MADRFTDWDIRLSALEKMVKTNRANTFTAIQAVGLYDEIRQYNNDCVKELNALTEAKRRAHGAVLFPAIREEIALWRLERKEREVSKVAAYDSRADSLKDLISERCRKYG